MDEREGWRGMKEEKQMGKTERGVKKKVRTEKRGKGGGREGDFEVGERGNGEKKKRDRILRWSGEERLLMWELLKAISREEFRWGEVKRTGSVTSSVALPFCLNSRHRPTSTELPSMWKLP